MARKDAAEPPAPQVDHVLRTILEGTAAETGSEFFKALVRAVAKSLSVRGAWVSELDEGARRLRPLAFWLDDDFIEGFEFDLVGTPCEHVIREQRLIYVPDRIIELYPHDPYLSSMMNAVSYLGAALEDTDGTVMGNLAILHDAPLERDESALAVFRIFAARAAAELRRLRAEEKVEVREEELALLVNSAMDAIVGLDPRLTVTRVNPAASKMLGAAPEELLGKDFRRFLARPSRVKLCRLIDELAGSPEGERSLWVSGGLEGIRSNGQEFPAEATLSRFDVRGNTCYTLILRDVNARRVAERRLQRLTAEAEYLREELEAVEGFGEIVGRSEPMIRMLENVRRVAATDATVLLLGETGTGKELIARAIHAASRRSGRRMVRVNCAAVPASLMESEFFGHEKGAFTGATTAREGRFALAHRGTIFLDEVGELPLELQAKLLRVLQEGEFEPLGSERTRTVDVRVIAATNSYLEAAVRAGDFREDLYYRLNVFPILVPPLRARGDDVILLAETFAQAFARKMGLVIHPLTEADLHRLRSYSWPGNVRELQNVMERGVITARKGRLDLSRALPGETEERPPESRVAGRPGVDENDAAGLTDSSGILTDEEVRSLERTNLVRALEAAGWQVSGEDGAARLLGLPPSTLSSRMRSLGIKRPIQRPASETMLPSGPGIARSRDELSRFSTSRQRPNHAMGHRK